MKLITDFTKKAMEGYEAVYFHLGGINNSWPYMGWRMVPYKQSCFGGVEPDGYFILVSSSYIGSCVHTASHRGVLMCPPGQVR